MYGKQGKLNVIGVVEKYIQKKKNEIKCVGIPHISQFTKLLMYITFILKSFVVVVSH